MRPFNEMIMLSAANSLQQNLDLLGFITLDNMLSALVGQIRDEFRQSRNDWMTLDDGSPVGKGSLSIFTMERALGIDIDNDQVDSVGGLIMWKLGDLPEEGDRIEFGQFNIVVTKMSGPRIIMVRIYPNNPAPASVEE